MTSTKIATGHSGGHITNATKTAADILADAKVNLAVAEFIKAKADLKDLDPENLEPNLASALKAVNVSLDVLAKTGEADFADVEGKLALVTSSAKGLPDPKQTEILLSLKAVLAKVTGENAITESQKTAFEELYADDDIIAEADIVAKARASDPVGEFVTALVEAIEELESAEARFKPELNGAPVPEKLLGYIATFIESKVAVQNLMETEKINSRNTNPEDFENLTAANNIAINYFRSVAGELKPGDAGYNIDKSAILDPDGPYQKAKAATELGYPNFYESLEEYLIGKDDVTKFLSGTESAALKKQYAEGKWHASNDDFTEPDNVNDVETEIYGYLDRRIYDAKAATSGEIVPEVTKDELAEKTIAKAEAQAKLEAAQIVALKVALDELRPATEIPNTTGTTGNSDLDNAISAFYAYWSNLISAGSDADPTAANQAANAVVLTAVIVPKDPALPVIEAIVETAEALLTAEGKAALDAIKAQYANGNNPETNADAALTSAKNAKAVADFVAEFETGISALAAIVATDDTPAATKALKAIADAYRLAILSRDNDTSNGMVEFNVAADALMNLINAVVEGLNADVLMDGDLLIELRAKITKILNLADDDTEQTEGPELSAVTDRPINSGPHAQQNEGDSPDATGVEKQNQPELLVDIKDQTEQTDALRTDDAMRSTEAKNVEFTVGGGRDENVTPSNHGLQAGAVVATGEQINEREIANFTVKDTLEYKGTELSISNFSVEAGLATLHLDTDGDGRSDSTLKLVGDFANVIFKTESANGNTKIAADTIAAQLADGATVDDSKINGIYAEAQAKLTGNGNQDFRVTVKDVGYAEYNNVVGAYEVNASGEVVNTTILTTDASERTVRDGSIVIRDIAAGNKLGFFIIQDGAEAFGRFDISNDQFSFVRNVDGNMVMQRDGTVIEGIQVLHSFDRNWNADDQQHVLSGVAEDGDSIYIGFEDLIGSSDKDYEDIVLHVDTI